MLQNKNMYNVPRYKLFNSERAKYGIQIQNEHTVL